MHPQRNLIEAAMRVVLEREQDFTPRDPPSGPSRDPDASSPDEGKAVNIGHNRKTGVYHYMPRTHKTWKLDDGTKVRDIGLKGLAMPGNKSFEPERHSEHHSHSFGDDLMGNTVEDSEHLEEIEKHQGSRRRKSK